MLDAIKAAAEAATNEYQKRQADWGAALGESNKVDAALEKSNAAVLEARTALAKAQDDLTNALNATEALTLQKHAITAAIEKHAASVKEAQRAKNELDQIVERLEPTIVVTDDKVS